MQSPELPEIQKKNKKIKSEKQQLNKSNLRIKLESGEFSSENSEIITNKFIIEKGRKRIIIRKSLIQNPSSSSLKTPLLKSGKKNRNKNKKKKGLKFSSNKVHLVQSFKKYNKKTRCCFFYEY